VKLWGKNFESRRNGKFKGPETEADRVAEHTSDGSVEGEEVQGPTECQSLRGRTLLPDTFCPWHCHSP